MYSKDYPLGTMPKISFYITNLCAQSDMDAVRARGIVEKSTFESLPYPNKPCIAQEFHKLQCKTVLHLTIYILLCHAGIQNG